MLVLESTRPVVEGAMHVAIDDEAIARWAHEVSPVALRPAGHELLSMLAGSQEKLANLVLLIDALNFCFWSSDPLRFEWRGRTYERFNAMFVSLLLAARYEPGWYDPRFWLEVPADEIRQVLGGKGELLLMDEREKIIRETGRILVDRFDGQFMFAIESVANRAWPLAVLLMTEFDSFRDVANYRGKIVYFMKRAQIAALDISMAWQTHDYPPLAGLDELTAFADYRIPQALRHLGVLRFSEDLARRVDTEEELAPGSPEEIEIRAASIHAVDRMSRVAATQGKRTTPWQVDWYLWDLSHRPDVTARHHRTRTVFY
ncbi:MAG: hypothetical protein DCC65_09170 [Planctomycetota bacterium]|nr:MAG: hypothetical protein DCC65_09170 [Planctomycetota bacterium]